MKLKVISKNALQYNLSTILYRRYIMLQSRKAQSNGLYIYVSVARQLSRMVSQIIAFGKTAGSDFLDTSIN